MLFENNIPRVFVFTHASSLFVCGWYGCSWHYLNLPFQLAEVNVMSVELKTPPAGVEIPSPREWEAVLDRVRQAMGAATYVEIDPKRLRPFEGQPREYFNEGDLLDLRDSIVSVGQFQPGIIRNAPLVGITDHELVDGERRWRAIMLGNVPTYKAMLVEIDDEAAPFVVASIANFNRKGHTDVEISNAIARLHDQLKVPMEIIAKMYNISVFWARELYGLQKLDPKIRGMLDPRLTKKQRLPVTVAIQVAKLDQSVQGDLVQRYRDKKVTVTGLRKEALRIAQQSGTPIRKRDVGPQRLLLRVERLSGALARTTRDLLDALKEEGAPMALGKNLPAAYRAQTSIEEAMRRGEEAKSIIAKIREEGLRPTAASAEAKKPEPKASVAEKFATYHNQGVVKDQGKPVVPAPKAPPPPSHPWKNPRKHSASRPPASVPSKAPRMAPKPAPVSPKPVLTEDERRWAKGITVNRWDDKAVRLAMTEATPKQYLRLWDDGKLEFQQHSSPKPDHLPSREQIVALIEKLDA